MNNILFFLFLMTMLCKCDSSERHRFIDNCTNIDTAVSDYGFYEIYPYQDKFLLTYSFKKSLSGATVVLKDSFFSDFDTIFHDSNSTIKYQDINEGRLGFVIYRKSNDYPVIVSDLMVYDSSGIKQIQTPLESIKFLSIIDSKGGILIEGSEKGTGKAYITMDDGMHWELVVTVDKYKYIEYISRLDEFNFIALGSKDFPQNENELIIVNPFERTVFSIMKIGKVKTYTVLGTFYDYSFVKNNQAECIKLNGKKIIKQELLNLPVDLNMLANIYYGDSYVFISGVSNEGRNVSWISFDKGNTWLVYNETQESILLSELDGDLILKKGQFICKLSVVW